MSIKYAMLGFLSWCPFTGYELKKVFASSLSLYWSDNNNLIYRTLVQMHKEGLVENEVQQQDKNPARKIYTITQEGRRQLKEWVQSFPDLPQIRNSFLIQLAWADQLDDHQLNALLDRYEKNIYMRLVLCQEEDRRCTIDPSRTPRESFLWEMLAENRIGFYENELAWVRRLRSGLQIRDFISLGGVTNEVCTVAP